MCYGTSHLRTAHPIRGQQLVSRIIIVKVRKRKDHGITPWKRCSHKKGGSVKGAGPLFLSLLSFPGTGMLDKPIPEAGEFGEKAGFQFLHGGLERFRRVVPRKLTPAREHVHPDVPVEDDPPPPRGGEAGGVGVSGRYPDAARWSFIAFRPASTAKRIRRTAPSCSSPESGDNKKASSKRLNVWRKCCREAEDGVKKDGITFPLDKPVKRLKPLFRAVHRFFHSVVDYSVFWRR